jgi:hypothetical protein
MSEASACTSTSKADAECLHSARWLDRTRVEGWVLKLRRLGQVLFSVIDRLALYSHFIHIGLQIHYQEWIKRAVQNTCIKIYHERTSVPTRGGTSEAEDSLLLHSIPGFDL